MAHRIKSRCVWAAGRGSTIWISYSLGSCLYFEDYRNPGSRDLPMQTWKNLVELKETADALSAISPKGAAVVMGGGEAMRRGDTSVVPWTNLEQIMQAVDV